MTVSPG